MSNESELKVKVSTVADTKGVVETTDAFKQLDITASKTANNIQVALAKTEVAEKSQTAESKAAAQERAQAALREIASREAAAKAAEEAKQKLTDLGKTTKDVAKVGNDLSSVMEGLARGDLAGLAQAGRGLKDVLGAVATTAGSVLLPAVVALGGAFVLFKSILGSLTQETARYYKQAADASERYKVQLEAATKANATLIEKQVADIQKIAAAYDAVTAAIDKAYARQQKIDTAKAGLASAKLDNQEKQELAKAKTPEQAEAIKQKFSDKRLVAEAQQKFNEFDTVDARAFVDTKNATEAQQKAAAENQRIEADRQAAKEKFEQATQTARTLESANGATGPTLQAQADAKAAKKAYDDLVTATDANFKTNSETFAKSQEKIDAAATAREENALNRQKFREELTGKQLDLQASAKATQKEIGAKLTDANANGTDVTQDVKTLRRQLANEKGTSGLIGNLLNQDTKNQDTTAGQLAQRQLAGVIPVVQGANGKPQGGEGTITKDGQEIKITGDNTVAELKKVTGAIVDSSKATDKAATEIAKAATSSADALSKYHSGIVRTFDAQARRMDSLSRQIEELARAQRAKADRS